MQHHFTVPVPVDVAWSALLDPERVAPCMPGATLTKAEGNEFAGSVKVKLGPISLLYKGTGSFTHIDAEARRVVIDASGKDSRGNGTAAATVTAVLSADGEGTAVTVDTDLKITGKPAQFGRGLISEVGGKLLNQFAECLAERLAEPTEEAAEPADAPAAAAAASALPTAEPVVPVQEAREDGSVPGWRMTGVESTSASPEETEAIDLLDTAGAPVFKRIAPIAAGLVVLAILFRLLRRRKRGH